MKTVLSTRFLRRAIALLLGTTALVNPVRLKAQTAVSNLGQTSSAQNFTVGRGASGDIYQDVFSFTTGSTAAAFSGVTIKFSEAAGAPSGLTLGLYSSFSSLQGAGASGLLSSLSLVSGDPLTLGNVAFSGSASLAANTTYFLWISATTSTLGTNYTWKGTTSGNEDGGALAGWLITDGFYNYNQDDTWSFNNAAVGVPQFSVQASAVPEPGTYAALAGAAVLGLAMWRRRGGRNLAGAPNAE